MTEVKKVSPGSSAGERGEEVISSSDREKEIVQLMVQGYGNQEIAEALLLDEPNLNDCVHGIFDKFGVTDRFELVLFAVHQRLIG